MSSGRIRILLIAIVWVSTLIAMWLWLGSSQIDRLTLGAGHRGSETHQLSSAVTQVLHRLDNKLNVSVFETGGSLENLELLLLGKIDMGIIQADTPVPDGVNALAVLYTDAYHLIVSDESGIRNFADLRGKRVAIPPVESGQNGSFWFLARHYGLAASEMSALPMAEAAADFAMIMDQVDAVFRVRAPGNDSIQELIGDHPMNIVPIGQAEALSLKQPALANGFIPRGSYRGYPPLPENDLPTAVLHRLLVVREDMPVALAYRLTSELFESRSDIVALSRLGGFIAPLTDDANSVVPAHSGARRYFDREKPGMMQQNAKLASAGLYAVVLLFSGLVALRSHWLKARRMRMGDFSGRVMTVAEAARDNIDPVSLMNSKQQLMDILAEVVVELDRDKVSQEEFEHFSFTWQAVDALVRDRMTMANMFGSGTQVAEAGSKA